MCFNRKVLIGLGLAAIVLFAIAGRSGVHFLPALIALACPLSMFATLGGITASRRSDKSAIDTKATAAGTDELAELQAEVAQLRAAQTQRAPSDVSHRLEP
ncbi:MAG: hypothetical protein ABJD24_01670 [Acidimicrobiales bacterium]